MMLIQKTSLNPRMLLELSAIRMGQMNFLLLRWWNGQGRNDFSRRYDLERPFEHYEFTRRNIGDGSGALILANIKTTSLSDLSAPIGSFYQSIIGDMGVSDKQTIDLGKNASVLMENADQRRMSVSAVSLDEEMTMMIQYQHAYNAAARNITTVDEMLDKIINGMGLVGR